MLLYELNWFTSSNQPKLLFILESMYIYIYITYDSIVDVCKFSLFYSIWWLLNTLERKLHKVNWNGVAKSYFNNGKIIKKTFLLINITFF